MRGVAGKVRSRRSIPLQEQTVKAIIEKYFGKINEVDYPENFIDKRSRFATDFLFRVTRFVANDDSPYFPFQWDHVETLASALGYLTPNTMMYAIYVNRCDTTNCLSWKAGFHACTDQNVQIVLGWSKDELIDRVWRQ